jgi:phosphoglycolate phosphatase-like HAD superfamily hydrolase
MLWEWVNSGTQVFILDLDGTLMPTAEIDNECFWQAVFNCLGGGDQLPELHNFTHVTDTGILHEWCTRTLGRTPTQEETQQIKQDFTHLLEIAFNHQPEHFSPLPGVVEWLDAVMAHEHVVAGIATGGWQQSACLKLKLSGLDRFDLPLASSDDAIKRADIMQFAARRTIAEPAAIEKEITYIGDGTWDLKASRELDWNFIGIATGDRAIQLKNAGAGTILKNFCKK